MNYTPTALVALQVSDLGDCIVRLEQQMNNANRSLVVDWKLELKRCRAHLDRLIRELDPPVGGKDAS